MVALPLSVAGGLRCAEDGGVPLALATSATKTSGTPRIYAVAAEVPIVSEASRNAPAIGSLRLGGSVERSAEPAAADGCAQGWYAVRPRGFVCASAGATLSKPASPQLLAGGPDLNKPLPYRYARARRDAAIYDALPSAMVQRIHERRRGRLPADSRRLGAGANDVPLDADFMPAGPPVILPTAAGVGDDGYRTRARFFSFPTAAATLPVGASFAEADKRPIAQRIDALTGAVSTLRRRSVVPLVSSVKTAAGNSTRRFGLTADGRFIAIDQLRALVGSTWHGIDIRQIGLPVAFTLRAGVRPRGLHGDRTKRLDDEFEPRQAIPLTGRFRTVNKRRYYMTRQRRWIRFQDVIMVHKRHRFPDFARGTQRWLDLSLANQYLVAYEGRKPVYATLVSSGRSRLGDPEKEPATPRGVFEVTTKRVSADIDNREVGGRYQLEDIPWVIELSGGFAINAGVWLQRPGEARGHRNISLAPIDAHWLFHWVTPRLPDGWHSVVRTEAEPKTIVYVHK